MLAAAEMYVKGISTRAVEKVLKEFGIEGLSSTQVSRATALLDDDLEAWRNRPLGRFRYLFLDARYEKTRAGRLRRLRRSHRHRRGRAWSPARARRLDQGVGGRGALAVLPRKSCGARTSRRCVHHIGRPRRIEGGAQGRAASSISRRTPSIMRRTSVYARLSARSCATSGTRRPWRRPKPN